MVILKNFISIKIILNSSDSETDSCSSRSSYTEDDDHDDGRRYTVGSNGKIINDVYENDIDIDSGSCSGSCSGSGSGIDVDESIHGGSCKDGVDSEYDSEYEDDDTLWATIHNFPVSAIMLEKCDDTLDSLMMQEEDMKDGEWKSALFQIIMTLITYQKAFGFTHNDLHTNNVMFIYTEKEYIYYLYDKNTIASLHITVFSRLLILVAPFTDINQKLYVATVFV